MNAYHFAILSSFIPWLLGMDSAVAGYYGGAVSPQSLPWPGGVVPYVIDPSLTADQQQTYLDGLREYELAANVHFVAHTTETNYALFKYDPNGPNLVSGSQPQTVAINLLTRGQICHEMGHSWGLMHEHQRPDRDTYVTILYQNIIPGNNGDFDIDASGHTYGNYDFESVMHYGRDTLSTQPGVLDTIEPQPNYAKYLPRLGNFALSPQDRAMMAYLYGLPQVPLSSVVTTTADGGVGSLRAAMYDALDHPGTTVTFNIPQSDPGYANGVFTISPTGYLPPLVTNGTIIDATTQPGYAGKPVVFLSGAKLLPEAGSVPGFLFYEANSTVKGLGIQRFPWVGIAMLYASATGNRVTACSCGADATGNAAAPNVYQGIQISDGAHDNIIGGSGPNEGNLISGNSQYGIWMSGTSGNVILGNHIGANFNGTAALPNALSGIILTDGANHNTIGGTTGTAGNVISGNSQYGVWVSGTATTQNVFLGNYIGTNHAGTAALPNPSAGIILTDGANHNTIGGNTDAAANVLSGNSTVGLYITGSGTSANQVQGNLIGTSADGRSAVPNGFAGIYLIGGCSANLIGGPPGCGNLVSGNATVGILVADPGTTGNLIQGNRIGPDALGGLTLGNQGDGIWLTNGSQATLIGGTTVGAANLICGNSGRGIALFDNPTSDQSFRRNSIFGNGGPQIALYDGSNHSQAAPVLTSAVLTTATTLTGTLQGIANTAFTIEFFADPDSQSFIGDTVVTTNGSGTANILVTLPAIVLAGRTVCATATCQTTGDTSALSAFLTVTAIDTDHDGIPDAYENITPGLNATDAGDANRDNDGDGLTNLQEFLAGTDPNNPASHPTLTGAIIGTNFQLSFSTVAGRFYRIEKSADLSAWQIVATNVAGTGSTMQLSLPISPSVARQFFRVLSGQ